MVITVIKTMSSSDIWKQQWEAANKGNNWGTGNKKINSQTQFLRSLNVVHHKFPTSRQLFRFKTKPLKKYIFFSQMHAWPLTTNTPICWQELTSHRHSEHHTAQSQHIFSCSFQQSGSLGLIKLIQHRKMLLWTHKQDQNGFDCQTKEIQVSRKYPPPQKDNIYTQTTAYKPRSHIYRMSHLFKPSNE